MLVLVLRLVVSPLGQNNYCHLPPPPRQTFDLAGVAASGVHALRAITQS